MSFPVAVEVSRFWSSTTRSMPRSCSALVTSIIRQGVLGRAKWSYWKFLAAAATRYRHSFGSAMTLAVMGCIVNGPGESKSANIGISLPGTGESPSCPVFIDGQHFTTLRGTYDELSSAFRKLVDDYVEGTYERRARD